MLDTYYIAIRWDTEDVQKVRPDLDIDQCTQVLYKVKQDHDADTGINWDVLRNVAEELFPDRPLYRVTYESTQQFYVDVEATDADEAEAKAAKLDGGDFYHYPCADWEFIKAEEKCYT